VDIDLLAFNQGFKPVSPTFTVAGATGGSATVLADKRTARFVPTANSTGRASFAFTVKGSDGTQYTGSVSVLVEPSGLGPSGVLAGSRGPGGPRLDVFSREMRTGDRVGYEISGVPAALIVRNLSGAMVSRQELSNPSGSVEIAGWNSLPMGGYVLSLVGDGSISASVLLFKTGL